MMYVSKSKSYEEGNFSFLVAMRAKIFLCKSVKIDNCISGSCLVLRL